MINHLQWLCSCYFQFVWVKQFVHSKFGNDGLHEWLQSHCRKLLARLEYTKLKKAAITTQCAWRSKVARGELRKLKMVISNLPKNKQTYDKTEKENETNVEELASPFYIEKLLLVVLFSQNCDNVNKKITVTINVLIVISMDVLYFYFFNLILRLQEKLVLCKLPRTN